MNVFMECKTGIMISTSAKLVYILKFDPASQIQDLKQFGEFGDVNPSITDSATYTFMQAKTMAETFNGEKSNIVFNYLKIFPVIPYL